MAGNIKEITDENFESEVLKNDGLVLVDFWANWCAPCRQLLPILEDISNEDDNNITIGKVNIEESPDAPTKYGVRGIPTMILFKNGEPVGTKVGVVQKAQLKEWIKSLT